MLLPENPGVRRNENSVLGTACGKGVLGRQKTLEMSRDLAAVLKGQLRLGSQKKNVSAAKSAIDLCSAKKRKSLLLLPETAALGPGEDTTKNGKTW